MNTDDLITAPQYSLPAEVREASLTQELADLTRMHRRRCSAYDKLLTVTGQTRRPTSTADIPFLPVGLFKSHELSSVGTDERFKVMTSSGTSGQQVSRIVLDRETADLQTRGLAAVMSHVLGRARLPMLIVDSPKVVSNRFQFSARGAGVLGMMTFGRKHCYALDEDMNLDRPGVQAFLYKFRDQPVLIFGFTFMVWARFLQALRPGEVDLSRAVLIHSGGWKALQDQAVDNAAFKGELRRRTGLKRVHNFYGMVEQVGSVFIEGPDGYLHPPNFADVIIRDPDTWHPLPTGIPGVIQVLSTLPRSYPGHSILTEDFGMIVGERSPGPAAWGGKQLVVLGRVPKTQLRGCSDTYASTVHLSA